MDTWKICLLFTSIVLIHQGECLFQSANNLTWTKAQEFCQRNQSTLIPGTKGHLPYPHWTGLYRRLSDWLHALGCYDNQSVEGLGVLSTHTLDRGSVGLCQERCGSQGRFALKDIKCLCLSSVPLTDSLPPSRCDWSCNHDDDSHVNDCGGSDTYNVYKATPRQALQSEITVNCVVLGCYEQWSQIHTDNCTEDLGRVCQSEINTNKSLAPDEEDFKSWSETQSECKEEDSYLYGNFSLDETSGTLCGRLYDIRSNTPETWLGVARQVFLTKDRGKENVVIIDCQICWDETNCVLVKGCDSTDQTAYAVCGDASDLLPTTTEPTTTATTFATEIASSEITTAAETPTIMTETKTESSIEISTTSTTEVPTTTETQSTFTTEIPTTSTTEIQAITETQSTSTTEIPTTSTTEIPVTTETQSTSTTEIPTTSTTEIPTTTETQSTSTTEIPATTETQSTSTTEIPTTSTTEIPVTTETQSTSTTEIPTTSTTEIPSTTETQSTSTTEIPKATTETQTTSSTEILTTEAKTSSTTDIPTTSTKKILTTEIPTSTEIPTTTETTTKIQTTPSTEIPFSDIHTTTEISTSEIPTTAETLTTTTTIYLTTKSENVSTTPKTEMLSTTPEFQTTPTTEIPDVSTIKHKLTSTVEILTTTEKPAMTTEIPTPSTTVNQTTQATTVPLSNGKSSSAKQTESESKAEKAIAVTASLTIVGLIMAIIGIIWKRHLSRNKDKDTTEGTYYKHYSSNIYDNVILPGEIQKENVDEIVKIADHNSIVTEQLGNGGYTEIKGLYENGVPPVKTASLTQPISNDTLKSSSDGYQNMEDMTTKPPEDSPPYKTVINVPKTQSGDQEQYTLHQDRALSGPVAEIVNAKIHKSVVQVKSDGHKTT